MLHVPWWRQTPISKPDRAPNWPKPQSKVMRGDMSKCAMSFLTYSPLSVTQGSDGSDNWIIIPKSQQDTPNPMEYPSNIMIETWVNVPYHFLTFSHWVTCTVAIIPKAKQDTRATSWARRKQLFRVHWPFSLISVTQGKDKILKVYGTGKLMDSEIVALRTPALFYDCYFITGRPIVRFFCRLYQPLANQ